VKNEKSILDRAENLRRDLVALMVRYSDLPPLLLIGNLSLVRYELESSLINASKKGKYDPSVGC
jgi:hypothetical protein